MEPWPELGGTMDPDAPQETEGSPGPPWRVDLRLYRRLDVASKAAGLVLVAVALSGSAGPWSLGVGILGVAIGVSTVLLRPLEPEGGDGEDDAA